MFATGLNFSPSVFYQDLVLDSEVLCYQCLISVLYVRVICWHVDVLNGSEWVWTEVMEMSMSAKKKKETHTLKYIQYTIILTVSQCKPMEKQTEGDDDNTYFA